MGGNLYLQLLNFPSYMDRLPWSACCMCCTNWCDMFTCNHLVFHWCGYNKYLIAKPNVRYKKYCCTVLYIIVVTLNCGEDSTDKWPRVRSWRYIYWLLCDLFCWMMFFSLIQHHPHCLLCYHIDICVFHSMCFVGRAKSLSLLRR